MNYLLIFRFHLMYYNPLYFSMRRGRTAEPVLPGVPISMLSTHGTALFLEVEICIPPNEILTVLTDLNGVTDVIFLARRSAILRGERS